MRRKAHSAAVEGVAIAACACKIAVVMTRPILSLLVASLASPALAQNPCAQLTPAAALAQVNAARERGALCGARGGMAPAAPLLWNAQLQAMAEVQAAWLADHGALMHQGRNGETLRQRAADAGYSYARVAENVAQGQGSLAQALAGWTASESHCENLYDSAVSEMALACVPGAKGRPFWALVLGRPL